MYEAMALNGVEALKMATYLWQFDREIFVDNRDVANAREVGTVAEN